ncbi:MAG: TIGR00730 family Rossman fold protein [Clostridiales bacterium]|nr:TIGR00730 family Rossman fold protein [Clostridiales bacterium]
MNICVYGASSDLIDKSFIEAAEDLGREMAKRGHALIYGAGAGGVMGGTARGVAEGGGKIIGIAPSFFNVDGMIYENCTELIRTETMRSRKELMEQRSDAFIMAPGGIGTFDEFFEMLTLKQLSRHTKAMTVLNVNGYFDDLMKFIKHAIKENFIKQECEELYKVFEDPGKLLDYIEDYKPVDMNILRFKDV